MRCLSPILTFLCLDFASTRSCRNIWLTIYQCSLVVPRSDAIQYERNAKDSTDDVCDPFYLEVMDSECMRRHVKLCPNMKNDKISIQAQCDPELKKSYLSYTKCMNYLKICDTSRFPTSNCTQAKELLNCEMKLAGNKCDQSALEYIIYRRQNLHESCAIPAAYSLLSNTTSTSIAPPPEAETTAYDNVLDKTLVVDIMGTMARRESGSNSNSSPNFTQSIVVFLFSVFVQFF